MLRYLFLLFTLSLIWHSESKAIRSGFRGGGGGARGSSGSRGGLNSRTAHGSAHGSSHGSSHSSSSSHSQSGTFGKYGNSRPSYVAPPPYGWSSNGKPANPKLYQARQPPSYATYRSQSFAHRPPPPAYGAKPYGGASPALNSRSYAPPQPAYTLHNVAPAGQSFGRSSLMQSAIFYGIGGFHHYPHYYRSRTESGSSNATVNLEKDELFVPKLVPLDEVSTDANNSEPLLLETAIQNLPFYGYDYATWNSSEIVPREEIVTGFGNSLGSALFGFANWWNGKPAVDPEWEAWIDQHTTTDNPNSTDTVLRR